MPETFHCPNCNAALDYTQDMGKVVQCYYCGTSVVVPEHLHEDEPAPPSSGSGGTFYVSSTTTSQPQPSSNARITIVVLAALIICAVGAVPIFLMQSELGNSVSQSITIQGEADTRTTESGMSDATSLPASGDALGIILQIGTDEEGTGIGRFEDLRNVALDADGNIYTAEHQSERIQVFDATGEFITQWNLPDDTPIRGMDVSRDGRVYIIQGFTLSVYDGQTGELLETFTEPITFDTVTTLPEGGFMTADDDTILRFDPSGTITLNLPEALADRMDTAELGPEIGVTGTGDFVYLSANNNAFYIFNSEGIYQNRVGDEERFRAANDIVVDGSGNIYVSAIFGIYKYDSTGAYLGSIELDPGTPYFGLEVDEAGHIYIASRTKMVKIAIPDF